MPTQTSPIHLLSVARRATLGEKLRTKKDSALEKLALSTAYDASVRNANLPKEQIDFHEEILLMGLCGILETFLTDVTVEFLTCFPGGLGTKQFSLDALAQKGATSALLRESAEREINEMSYKTFPEMMRRLAEVFHLKQTLNGQLIDEVNEIKCTRDVYVHGKGAANYTYIRKTGALARKKLDEKLPLGVDYLNSAISKFEQLLSEFFDSGPSRYLDFGRVRAFREMWEATHLNVVMPFNVAWVDGGPLQKGGEHIVRPTEKALRWRWSHSEEALFDFFLGIYSPTHPDRKVDMIETLSRFPPSTPEGQVIISWMDAPFWF